MDLLPALDNFERALHVTEKRRNETSSCKVLKWCIKHFRMRLKEEGVEPIEAVGKEFDPHCSPSGHARKVKNMRSKYRLSKNSKRVYIKRQGYSAINGESESIILYT